MQQPKQFTNSSRAIDDASRLQFIVWCDSRQTCSTVINHTTIWRLNIVFGDTQFDFQCLCLRKTESEWKKSSFNNFFRDCASISGWNAKTCLISCRTRGEAVQSSKKLSHLENIGKSRYTISKPILCRCITQNAELDLEHNAPHLFENANDIILQSMHWIVMGALFSADKKIGCCF